MDTYLNMFVSDAKILRPIKNYGSCRELQADILSLFKWNQKWKMEYNVDEYHVIEFGESENRPKWEYKLGENSLHKSGEEKDLGVIINSRFS